MANALIASAANYATEAISDGWLPLSEFSGDMNCSDQSGPTVTGQI
jgi:hypothetical protein